MPHYMLKAIKRDTLFNTKKILDNVILLINTKIHDQIDTGIRVYSKKKLLCVYREFRKI